MCEISEKKKQFDNGSVANKESKVRQTRTKKWCLSPFWCGAWKRLKVMYMRKRNM